ncbi:MAG: oligosaccharide repeat unit polymerase [Paludibacteraceae bacterium]|nr:oligosaccharide repeat unit polymerase [Paludibacteraceae bacterium]
MNWRNILLFFVLFFSLRCFSLIYLPSNFGFVFVKLLFIYAIIYYLLFETKFSIKRIDTPFKRIVLLFMLYPFVGIITAYFLHRQSPVSTVLTTSLFFSYFSYFLLWKYKFKESEIIKVLFVLVSVWTLIEIVEVNTSIRIFIGDMGEDAELGERNGLVRLRVPGEEFAFIALFYSFQKYLESLKKVYLLICVFFFVGIYLTLTRQFIFTAIFCILVGFFIGKKVQLKSIITLLVIGVVIFVFFYDVIFKNLFVSMGENINDEDYIRYIAFYFFGIEYNKTNILAILFGNGLQAPGTQYHLEMVDYQDTMHLFLADVGIVGDYFNYGIIYVAIVIAFFYMVCKNRKYIDLYLILSVLQIAMTCIAIHHFTLPGKILKLTILMYLIEISVLKHKRGERVITLLKER